MGAQLWNTQGDAVSYNNTVDAGEGGSHEGARKESNINPLCDHKIKS